MPVFVSHLHKLETLGVPMYDATVLRASELFQQSHNILPTGYYILGDSAGWLHIFEIMEI